MTEPAAPKKKRRKMAVSPTRRSLAWLRTRGWPAQVVEQTIPRCFIKRDLFGLVDIVVLDGQPGVLGVQATSGDNVAAHKTKAEEQAHFRAWLGAGNRFEIHGWTRRAASPQAWGARKRSGAKMAVRIELRRVVAGLVGDVVTWREMDDG